jgi:uncharacterized protein (TIGR00730 family)
MARKRRIRPDVSEEHPLPTEHAVEPSLTEQLVDEIRETADKLAHDNASVGDLKILSRALKELRYAFKVFTPYRRQRKVTVFGSARLKPDHVCYQQAVDFGRRMANAGWYVVTGAGGGIMEAAHVGAGRKMSMGLNIMLPFEQEANPVIDKDEKLVHFKYFFTRKLLFVKEVHAIALFAGGFGTQDEAWETLTLVQTGKRDLMPIVFVDPPGQHYWTSWQAYVREQLLADGLISPEDMSLFTVVGSVQEAFDEIIDFYSVYNSMRYVRDKLYLRLHREPSDQFVEELNDQFADILEGGRIEKCPSHPLEKDDSHLSHLPRLSMKFNRRDIGRLRQLVDLLNRRIMADDEEE